MTKQLELPLAEALANQAPLLEYPFESFESLLEQAISSMPAGSAASESLLEFQGIIKDMTLEDLEELYTRTFDLAPLCVPYVSSYIYGDENFERGSFMSGLCHRFTESGFASNAELPDHIALLLRFAPSFEDVELHELIEFCLFVAVDKMMLSLKEADNPYFLVLKSVKDLIESVQRGKLS